MLWLILLVVMMTAGGILVGHGLARVAAKVLTRPLQVATVAIPIGACLPGLFMAMGSASAGLPTFTLQGVIGANIIDILLVLGLCGLIRPINVSEGLLRQHAGLAMVTGSALLATALGFDRYIGGPEGILLAMGIVVYWWFLLEQVFGGEYPVNPGVQFDPPAGLLFGGAGLGVRSAWAGLACVLAGLVVLVPSALLAAPRWRLLAEKLPGHRLAWVLVPGLVMALPQIFFAVAAVRRRAGELAMGVLLGSYCVNCLLVVGSTAAVIATGDPDQRLFHAIPFPETLWHDHGLPMWLAPALLLPSAVTGDRFGRVESLLLLLCFTGYALYVGS